MVKNENAVIHRAGGGVDCAIVRAFARENSKVFLTDCHRASIHNKFAKDILFVGGVPEAPEVDSLNAQAVEIQI